MSRRPIMLLGGMVAWLVALIGFQVCSPDDSAPAGNVMGTDFEVLAPPKVRVAFRGIEPRRLLVYAPEEGAKRDFELVIGETSTMQTAGELLAAVDREASFHVRGEIDTVHPDGSFRWEWKVKKSKALLDQADGPMGLKDWRRAVKSTKGMKGWSTIAPSGVVLESARSGGGSGARPRSWPRRSSSCSASPACPCPPSPWARAACGRWSATSASPAWRRSPPSGSRSRARSGAGCSW